jgi:lipoprotein-anchoring transpeptidase ErfK/SrfK
MRTRSFIIIGLTLTILFGGAGALYAYDSSGNDKIAKGITVGGVDIGGLTAAQARARLNAQLLGPLQKPIVVSHEPDRWTLGPREAKLAVNIDDLVAKALTTSGKGNIFSRSYRRLTGGSVDTTLDPRVTFSDKAVSRLLDRVRGKINRKPVDASLSISVAGFKKVDDKVGLEVERTPLENKIKAALASPTGDRTLIAETKKTQPKVTTASLAKKSGTILVVSKSKFTVRLYKNLKFVKSYGIAIGAPGHDTPEGTFHVQNKQVDPVWSVPNSPWAGELAGTSVAGGTAANPLKARWMGVTDGVGFHGTSDDGSIGSAASHGCMRMHVSDVIDLYPRVPVGATVYISH